MYLLGGEHFTAMVPRAHERAERIDEWLWTSHQKPRPLDTKCNSATVPRHDGYTGWAAAALGVFSAAPVALVVAKWQP